MINDFLFGIFVACFRNWYQCKISTMWEEHAQLTCRLRHQQATYTSCKILKLCPGIVEGILTDAPL